MKATKAKYPIDQCALYKCRSRKRLESLLTIESGDLRNIESVIKYHSFDIDKKDSTNKRHITAPSDTIKKVQTRILNLLQPVERPSWLISGEKGKCYIDNGKAHQNANYVITMDIKSFYDNCNRESVYQFFITTLLVAPDVAKILTDIVTYNGRIPTGCPTSQIIAFYAYENMFKEIQVCAQQHNCLFTLYVDDMTFSSVVPFDVDELKRNVDIILRKYGHRPKYQKVKYFNKAQAKPITGTVITTNHILDIPNKLQKHVFDNFQNAKNLDPQDPTENDIKTVHKLVGQLQAAKNIDGNRFPEISRLTADIQSTVLSKEKPKHRTKSHPYRHGKIKIPTTVK